MRQPVIRRCIVSTLSEIAANHARNALAAVAEPVRLSEACPLLTRALDAVPLLPVEQMPAHTIAAINVNLSVLTTGYQI
jgi:hypothetical protein